jgi:hypothetical protein
MEPEPSRIIGQRAIGIKGCIAHKKPRILPVIYRLEQDVRATIVRGFILN